MATSYLVRKERDGSILSLIRSCDSGAIEHMIDGEWLPAPNAFAILVGELGEEITVEEARDIAPRFGGTIESEGPEKIDC